MALRREMRCMSIQSAKKRPLPEKEEAKVPAPRPESVRMSIVCLYGAAFISACFLILNGQVQWYEGNTPSLSPQHIALVHMGFSALADAAAGFLLSRCFSWSRIVLFVLAGTSLLVHAMTFSPVAALSPGFCISRLLALLMEAGAVILCLVPSARAWFTSLDSDSSSVSDAGK